VILVFVPMDHLTPRNL